MRTTLKFALALGAAAAFAAPVQAQITDNIDATASVLQGLTVTGDASLAFGNIAPSQVKTVAAGAAASGHFSLNGAPGSSVSVRFNALPANLQIAGLTLSAWSGLHRDANTAAGAAAFVPTAGVAQSITMNAIDGNYFVWLGATLTAAAVVPPGSYTEPIVLEVFYN